MEKQSNQTPQPTAAQDNQQPASQPQQYQQPIENPGQTLGIIGLVLNFVGITIGGIILGAMSRSKSKAAGMSTTLGTVSLVWGIIVTVLAILGVIGFFIIIAIAAANGDMTTTPSYSY